MNKFRLLEADEIECRIATVKATGLSLFLYKTARTDANLLDETVGEDMWENDFKLIDGVLYGGIGIHRLVSDADGKVTDKVVWKWDAGSESDAEVEKGRASDGFKRAGFKWGIGRELYTAPFIWIKSTQCNITKNDKGKDVCFDRFEVSKIGYNEKSEIEFVEIINSDSRVVVFSWEKDAKKETYKGDGKITGLQLKSLTKSCKEDGIDESYICELYSVIALADMTEAQMANLVNNWEKMKKKYNERKNS